VDPHKNDIIRPDIRLLLTTRIWKSNQLPVILVGRDQLKGKVKNRHCVQLLSISKLPPI